MITNQEHLACAEAGLPFKRQNSVDNYLIGILSVLVDEATWHRAVDHAIEMEARIYQIMEQQAAEAQAAFEKESAR